MLATRTFLAVGVLLLCAATAFTQPSVAVNGAWPPAVVAANAGGTASVVVSGGPANPTDWIALYAAGAPDSACLWWQYLNGATVPPASGMSGAALTFDVPVVAGDYELRFFANNGYARLATSGLVTVLPSQAQIVVNGTTSPAALSAAAGSDAVVVISGGPGNRTDWVGLYAVGAANASQISWQYLSGTTAPPASGLTGATLRFAMPAVAGSYELRLFADNSDRRLATSGPISVAAPPATLLVNGVVPPVGVTIGAGSRVTVGVSDGPGNAADWIGLYAVGSAETAHLVWRYLNGTTTPPANGVASASLTFDLPVAGGHYEFRLFANGSFSRLATSTVVTVTTSQAQLAINGTSPGTPVFIVAGADANVAISGGPGNATDWVALYAVGAPDSSTLAWRYLSGTTAPPANGLSAATVRFTMPTVPGPYEFRFFASNGYGRLATSATITLAPSAAQIAVNDVTPPATVTVGSGQQIAVHVINSPGNASDWVALVPVGAPDTASLAWQYLSGTSAPPAVGVSEATLTFTMPSAAGAYEFRLYASNGFGRLATSSAVTVPPAPPACAYALSRAALLTSWTGRADGFTLTTEAGCAWTAGHPSWMALTKTSGQGPAVIGIVIDANTTGVPRVGTIEAGGRSVVVTQAAGPCEVAVSPNAVDVGQPGGSGSLTASALWGCTRPAISNVSWMSVGRLGYADAVLTDAPAAYWRLGDAGSTTAADRSGNGIDAVLAGTYGQGAAASIADGDAATAFATDAYAHVGYRQELDPASGSFSLEAWVRFTAPTTGSVVGAVSDVYGYQLQLNGTRARFRADYADPVFVLESTAELNDGLWHHLVGVFDATAGEARLFVDGVLNGTAAAMGPVIVGGDFIIGARSYATEGFVSATIDEVAYFPRALTAERIAAHFAAQHGPLAGEGPIEDVVTYAVEANPTGLVRNGTLSVGDRTFTVTQTGLPCSLAVAPPAVAAPEGGSGGRLRVTGVPGCSWSASTDAPWITIGGVMDGYRGQVLADAPSAYWRLGDTGTTVAVDASGRGFDAAYDGAYQQGMPGATADGDTATRFQTDGYGYVWFYRDGATIVPTGPLTFEAWVQYRGQGGTVVNTGSYLLDVGPSGAHFSATYGEGQTAFDLQSAQAINDGAWHHLVGTVDANGLVATLFVDGVLEATSPITGYLRPVDSLSMGPATAVIDEVAVYPAVLTSEQVRHHYDAQVSPGGGTGLLEYLVAPNPAIEPRSGVLHVAGVAIPVTQAARHCIDVSPTAIAIAAAGGSGTVAVSALAGGCGWVATSDVPWIGVQPSAGAGPEVVQYAVAVNDSVLRRIGRITIGGQAVTVTQGPAPLQRPVPAYGVVAGVSHTLAVKIDGTVWSWGANDSGQLGDGTSNERFTPAVVPSLSSVVAVAAGHHSMALTSDGSVWTWGSSRYGQLGVGAMAYSQQPVPVSGLGDVVAIAAGRYHSVALKSDGTVWTWGWNYFGQLGDGTTANRSVPVEVTGLNMPAVAIAATGDRTMLLAVDGSVWGFGYNANGELGDGNPWQAVTWLAQAAGLPPTVNGIGAGGVHAFATAAEGQLWAWGGNASGQLGDGTKIDRLQPVEVPGLSQVTEVRGGAAHTVALRTDGTVWAWGANESGQLGNGTPPCSPSDFVECSARQAVAVPAIVVGPLEIVAVSANGAATFAVAADGRLWAWGNNDARRLGDGTTESRPTPIQIAEPGFVWRTGTPILQAGGTSFDAFQVHGGSTTSGAVLRYTTNGSDPTETDAVFPVAGIFITETTTVKLRAWAAGRPPSNVASATYVLKVRTPEFSPAAAVFTTPQTITISTPTAGTSVFYTTDGSTPAPGAPTTAAYAGGIAIGTRTQLIAIGRKAGWADSDPGIADYRFNYGQLAAPVFTPPSGAYVYGDAITLSASPTATIRYTTDGSQPTAASPVYAGPIALTGSLTATAAAFHPDWTESLPTTAAYTAKAAAPVFSPGAGSYAEGSRITVASATPGAVIRYSTNGLDPGVNDPVIASGASLAVGNYTLRARTFRPGLLPSDQSAAEYSREGDACRLSVSPQVVTVGASPAGGLLSVTATDSGCSWTARTDAPWIAFDAVDGSGLSGNLAYHVAANPGTTLRVGLITVGDVDVVVVQLGTGTCAASVSPPAIAATASATTGALDVVFADAGCAWSASVDVPWLTFAAAHDASAYARAVMADHPVGYWPLAEPGGATTVADASGFGHDGAVTAGVALGQPGARADGRTAAVFDGTGGAVVIPPGAIANLGAFTWEAWVKVGHVLGVRRDIVSLGGSVGSFSLALDANASQATFEVLPVGGGRQTITLDPTVVGVGWVHLAFTADGTTWRAYVNGTAVQSGTMTGGLTPSVAPLVFGRDGLAAQGWYDGALADVAVYPYALSRDQVAHHVGLRQVTAAGGTTLAYTLEPNASGAGRTGTLTVAGVSVPVSQAAMGGVAIVGGAMPSANAAGWHQTDVTVSFTCAGAGTLTCPAPIAVAQEGEHDVEGVASNDLGATATTSVHVAIDKTAPLVLITSPTRGELVEAGPVVIRGTATDGLSGLLGVACNGTAATLDDTGFTCQVTVPVGTTTIEVQATDVAANVRTVTVEVTTVDDIGTTPPTRLRVSPATATMVVGASRAFAVRDDRARIPRGATWSVDTEGVVSLEPAANGVTVVAQAAGVVHVTASWQGLTADAEVTVLATVGTTPEVVTLWSAPTVGGAVQRIVQGATMIDGTHRLYTYESTGEDDGQDVIRAFEADGREAWSAAAGGRVLQLSGDPSGGVVALVDDRPAYTSRLLVFGPSGSGGGGPAGVGPFAIHPNGPLYYVDQTNTLIGLDIGLGSGPGTTVAGTPGYPTVLLDGSVVVPSVLDPQQFQLTFVRPDGAVETQTVNLPNGALWYPYRAVPNGQGGLLVQMRRLLWPEMETHHIDALVVGVDAGGTVTGSTPLADDWGEIVVGEHGQVLVTSEVEYWTEPGSGGVAKRHVGFLQQITPEGNPAAFPQFFPPSGPCGWVWDGMGERWYYNGDCDQEVISITSIAARGSDTLLTLNDGRVFAPGALSQLHLSYLVPAADGTYLGSGAPPGGPAGPAAARGGAAGTVEAGALMALAVTSEEPASPLGSPWPTAGGNAEAAFAENPGPIIVGVTFDPAIRGFVPLSEDEWTSVRKTALKAMQDAYEGYAVTFSEGQTATRHIRVQNRLGAGVGETNFPSYVSDVNFWNVLNTLQEVVGCRALQFNECPQKTGLPRAELVQALGAGIGATGAHELGHQYRLSFVGDVTCDDCYDSGSAVTHAHFFGPKRWSDGAREKMRRVLPPR